MKTDRYLNLCLEQAANSTLRHRHGCIVVKGGKVIGQGFNDPRPGFDGGDPNMAASDRSRASDQSLSMHSEMMAIHSVLSSSASATTAKAERRIARDLKRDRGMRREAVNSYAERIIAETLGRGLALPTAESGFEPRRCRVAELLSREDLLRRQQALSSEGLLQCPEVWAEEPEALLRG
jgi:hypothetical protein